jgi:acyl-coenzyme A synthetase/AMP-(fatty) acid ligase
MDAPEPPAFRAALRDAIHAPPNRLSVIADSHRQCRYPEVPEFLAAIQRHIADCGARPGDCLTLELANSVPSALTVLACLDAGYSVMLMPIEGLGARAVGSEFPAPRFARSIVTVRDGLRAAACDLAAPSTYLDVRPNSHYDVTAAQNERRARIYLRTSGSLGAPKLVVRSHARFLTNVRHARERLGLDSSHRVALPIPIFHGFGLGPAFLGCLLGGASIDLLERTNLPRYLDRERVFEPNVAFVTPSFCEILVRGRRAPRPYAFMVTGGDRIGRTTFFRSEEMHGPLINAYGGTEMGFVFSGDLRMSAESRFRTVGRPLPGVTFRFVQGVGTSAHSAVGALQIQYLHGFEGYVDLNGVALQPEGAFDGNWYCTGDAARLDPDGMLEVLGRSDLSVNRNGLLLTFADVEAVLREVEGIEDVGVAAGPDSIRGRLLVAFCVLERGVKNSNAQLRAQCAKRAPAFAVPDLIRVVSELPRLASGKIDRSELVRMARLEGLDSASTPIASDTLA